MYKRYEQKNGNFQKKIENRNSILYQVTTIQLRYFNTPKRSRNIPSASSKELALETPNDADPRHGFITHEKSLISVIFDISKSVFIPCNSNKNCFATCQSSNKIQLNKK